MDIETVKFILAAIVLLIGIALALFGRAIWGSLLSAIGSMIGWMVGFAIGFYFFGFSTLMGIILTIIIAFIASFIMGAIFQLLVELALALLTAILAAGLFYYFNQDQVVIALIIFAVVFILAYVFIEKVVIVVTAFIGSILAAIGIYFLTYNTGYTAMGFIGLFIIGCLVQYFLLEGHDSFLV